MMIIDMKKLKGIWNEKNERRLQYIWLGCIIIVFGITRLWQLTTLPLGVHIDEAGMGYDALCLAKYGVDRHMKSWPVYLKNFSYGQSSLYAFVCALILQFMDFGILALRLPATIFSGLSLIFGMKIMKLVYQNSLYPSLFVGSLITISPYFILNSRFGLDCNLMLGATMVFLYFFMSAMKSGELWRYVLSGLTGGMVLYSYALSYIILPLFLIFSLIYVILIKDFSLKKWVVMAIPMGILAFPLILVQIVNYFNLPEMKLGIFTITKMDGYRISEIGRITKQNIMIALQSIFIGDGIPFDSIAGIWNLYAISAFLFLIGLISVLVKGCCSIRDRKNYDLVFPMFWFSATLLLAFSMETNTYRINGVFGAVAIIAIEGICTFGRMACKYAKTIALLFFILIGCIYAGCFLKFAKFYYGGTYYDATYLKIDNFGLPIEEGLEFIENDEILSEKLTCVWERSIYYAISTQLPPWEFDVVGDAYGIWNNYWFGALPEITYEYNYIIPQGQYPEYCNAIRQMGFEEIEYDHYSVFYNK